MGRYRSPDVRTRAVHSALPQMAQFILFRGFSPAARIRTDEDLAARPRGG